MYHIDFKNPITVHFIGIGGISMSGLAEILLEKGFRITGSDMKQSGLTAHLENKGAHIFYGHSPENISGDVDAVVFTAAVHEDNPELLETRRRALPALTRAELLGQIMKNYDSAIAVAGTHGKTTTTSMLSHILLRAKKDPTITVGGMLDRIGGNIRIGQSSNFLTEACEYTNSFLSFYPTTEIILNIGEDHLDFFHDLKDIRNSFRRFMEKLPENGLLVVNGDIDQVDELLQGLACRIVKVGKEPDKNYYSACDIRFDSYACPSYVLTREGVNLGEIKLNVPGLHNVFNSLAAVAVALDQGIDLHTIQESLMEFQGTHRRFEKKGSVGGITIIDDYAHHPVEVRATLETAREYPHKKLWCVFQPHTYTRTKAFLEDFAKALSLADEVVLADIFAARETDHLGVSSQNILEILQKMGIPSHYFSSFDEIENFLLEQCQEGDMLITMGAGDIVKVGETLLGL